MPANRPTALILGAAVWPGGLPSPTLRRRVAHGVALYEAGVVGTIMGCGGLGRHGPSEAEVIARLCREAGVPDRAIRFEDRSTSTRENLVNAQALLSPDTPVVIVTDPYHRPRARLIARQIGLRATSSGPGWHQIGPRQLLRNIPREALAVAAVLVRLR
ncbi:YdcF family protein [Pararhodobacter marinus]|uniref:YdcF family protein n=1 Tax=Pararhodobacter marinus TaxID=2184063 RepID=UPI0035192E96